MIWRNPWAWIGLSALVVPMLVHLLGRRRPTPIAFPTLRFFTPSRLLPSRRHRITDVPLLVVRLAVVALAVAATAQPVFLGMGTGSEIAIARAAVVDASPSMSRRTPDGRPALDVARERAKEAAAESQATRTIETTSPREALPGVASWLSSQTGRRELVVLSDFQTGTLTREDFMSLPEGVGVRLQAIDVAAVETIVGPAIRRGDRTLIPALNVTADSTRVEWQPGPPAESELEAHVAPTDRRSLEAARAAALAEGVRTSTTLGRVVVTFPGAPEWPSNMDRLRPIDQPWMFDMIARLRTDDTLLGLMRRPSPDAGENPGPPPASAPTLVVRGIDGRARLSAGVDPAGPEPRRLLFFANAAVDDLVAPVLFTAIARAAGEVTTPDAELEPTRVQDDVLRQWERQPGAAGLPGDLDRSRSDGRWFWIAALAALGLETWLRRRPAATAAEVTHARVA